MDVIFGNVAFDDLDIHRLADLADQISQSGTHVSKEYRLAVFRDPNQVDLQII